ncbi:MAG: carbon starvation CstA family protein [Candidatus Omnitrophota bacterium]
MSLIILVISSGALLLMGYIFYGRFLSKLLQLNPDAKTPAVVQRDDVDYVPTNKFYLLGQHFSAIAAAGPIVGPILAGMWFGWVPTVIWIIVGGIFIGGVHDLFTLVASIRHHGRSIAEVIKEYKSKKAFMIFLVFLWISIIYIITAFTDMTAGTFADPARGAGVASSSMMYLLLALIMGILIRLFKPPLAAVTLIFMPLVLVCIWLGPKFPLHMPLLFGLDLRTTWDILLLAYCFIAAVIPVWLLLQPRGYLGGFFLTLTAGASLLGIIVGHFTQKLVIIYPAFVGWVNPGGLPLFPLLFTTVACGACSGFHALVSSGTTSKQVARETDAKAIGYGGMLLESVVAITALGTLLLLTRTQAQGLGSPDQIYANGIATFLNSLGIDREFALTFALLAFATFVYDTLDVATRLGRYIFQELTNIRGRVSLFVSAFATLLLPAFFVTSKMTDAQGRIIPAWSLFWTVFGSSNQLLAAMVLLGLSVWLFRRRKNYAVTLMPAIFMTFVSLTSLALVTKPWIAKHIADKRFWPEPLVITCLILFVLSLLLIIEDITIFSKGNKDEHEKTGS